MSREAKLKISQWLVMPSLNLLERGEQTIKVEPKTMDLLVCLARRAGRVVSVDELIATVWNGVVVGDGSVYLIVSRLRRLLDDDECKHIETIPKRGYRLTAPVVWLEPPASGAAPVADRGSGSARKTIRGLRMAAIGGALAVLVVAATVWAIRAASPHRLPSPDAVGVAQPDRSKSTPVDSPQVQRAILQILTGTSLPKELAVLDNTSGIDPHSARALALRAFLYSMSLTNTSMASAVDPTSRAETEKSVVRYAERALALDPNAVLAHLALGNERFFDWRWTEATASFERAAEANGNAITPGFASYVFLSSYLGRHDRAIELARSMIQTNPTSPYFYGFLGLALAYAGEYEAAERELQFVVDALPQYDIGRAALASVQIALGEKADALPNIKAIQNPERAYLLSLLGRQPQTAAAELPACSRKGADHSTGRRAMACLAAGDPAAALTWLERAAKKARRHEPDDGFFALMVLKMNVAKDPTLAQPEFADVLLRIHGD